MEIIAIALGTLFVLVVAYEWHEHSTRVFGENYGSRR